MSSLDDEESPLRNASITRSLPVFLISFICSRDTGDDAPERENFTGKNLQRKDYGLFGHAA